MKYIISSEDIEAETEYAKVLVLQVGCTLKHTKASPLKILHSHTRPQTN